MQNPSFQILDSSKDIVKLKYQNTVEMFENNSTEYADKVLYYFLADGENETDRITYKQMRDKAAAIAARLQQCCSQGDRALMLFPTGIEFIVSLYGCFYSGIIGVPAYPPRKNRSFARFEAIATDSAPKVILTTRKIYEDLQKNFSAEACLQNIEYIIYEDIDDTLARSWVNPKLQTNDPAYLQYTSGSTGKPNGVIISHGNILHNSEFIKRAFGHTDRLMGANWLPGFHDMGLVGALIQPSYVGGSNVIIPPNAFLLRPNRWLKTIGKYQAGTAGGPNFALNFCVDRISEEEKKDLDLSSLKPFYCGSEPIRKNALENFSNAFRACRFTPDMFYPCYGLAEATLIVTGGDLHAEPVYIYVDDDQLHKGNVQLTEPDSPHARNYVGCGYPMVGTKVVIVNPDTNTVCEQGKVGEIWCSGPSIAKGYWNNPKETAQTFGARLTTGEGPFMRTGDLGFIENGQLFISGRIKDLIIIRGRNHYPHDIEATVENCHEALNLASGAAFSIDIDSEERLVIVQEVKRTHMRNLDEDSVFESIRQAIAEEHQLQVYAMVLTRTGSIPKTSSGKIQRFECRKNYLDDSLIVIAKQLEESDDGSVNELRISRNDIHNWIISWMAKELKIDPAKIDISKPITAYGVDSIKAVIMARDAEEKFGIEWPLEMFLEETTIQKIATEGAEMRKRLGDVAT